MSEFPKNLNIEINTKGSIRNKVAVAISVVFSITIILLITFTYFSERQKNLDLAVSQVKAMNAFYFDSLNTLMIGDGLEEREELRTKFLEFPGVLNVRVMRGEIIVGRDGKGFDNQQPVDDLDQRALAGESILEFSEIEGNRTITSIEPYFLTKNTRGTDCLECHKRIKSGTLGGVVRIDYSLEIADQSAVDELQKKFIVISMLMLVGVIVLMLLLNKLIVVPAKNMRDRVKDIAAGEGDLTQTISINSKSQDELGQLAFWFNSFVAKLRSMIQEINQYSEHLNSSSETMLGIIQRTNVSITQQQAETEKVAQSMNEMTATVQAVSNTSVEAVKLADEANKEADEGKKVIGETIEMIDKLAEAVEKAASVIQQLESESNNITVVLDVIGSIAEQTNLLALNAAIEAARAGEQGRGFAVVADEVRSLAERTQQSTQEIQVMIESLQQGTKKAVGVMALGKEQATISVVQVAKAGNSLDTIAGAVNLISEMNNDIAGKAGEHSQASSEISQNVANINESATQTAVETNELSDASRELSDMADNLQKLLKSFKV
ncbi:MAG: methyl-accepting chemotaxis protein [Pseudomonadota bacterium]